MIEDLTKDKLQKYGFNETKINEILKDANYECDCKNDKGQYWVSMIEAKIYSGNEYFAKGFQMIFPKTADLLPEYYTRKEARFIEQSKEFAKNLFDEADCKEEFKKAEIEFVENSIKHHAGYTIGRILQTKVKLLNLYLSWIKKLETTIQQPAAKSINELINPELQPKLFNEVEIKIASKIENWKQRFDLIECAAFCQLLHDRKYFIKGSTNRKSVNEFSLIRYGVDISIQLESSKRKDRQTHKTFLERYFK